MAPGFAQWAVTISPDGNSTSAKKRLYRLIRVAGSSGESKFITTD
jgi:hypothetical protein